MTNPFEQLGLHPALVQTITNKGYSAPTPIQTAIIPAMLDHQDVIGQSQTGSGKTAAFGLPILHTIQPGQKYVQSLIMSPTRELAMQVANALREYGSELGARVLAVYGGQPYREQITALKKGVDIVVGTPGRILDLIEKQILKLDRLSSVILDEADEMLSMGFIDDIETILAATPDKRQTGLFSATMPGPIKNLAKRYLTEPQTFTMTRQQLTVETVDQRCYLINEADRLAALTRLFETEPIVSALVFSRTRLSTGELTNELVNRGFTAEVLNGDLSQELRERVLQRFRNNQIKVLVATDVAARGLDIEHVSHVFNYDLPQDPELYVHRIGRTGRAGKAGVAISLLTPREKWYLRKIETYTKQKITLAQLPTENDIIEIRDKQLVEKMSVWLNRGRARRERELVTILSDQGYDPIEIAAAALKLIRVQEKQRPIAPISELEAPRPNKFDKKRKSPARATKFRNSPNQSSHEEGMVRLTLNSGKDQGLNPGSIVGSIAFHADIPGSCIGRIDINSSTSFVDVPQQVVAQVMSKGDTLQIGRHRITMQYA